MIGKVLTRHFGNRRILVIVLFVVVGFGIPSNARMKVPPGLTPSTRSSNQTEVIERLSRFFGIDRVPARVIHRSPPQFMIDLYASITEPGGLVKRESPYKADVIRSFPDRGKCLMLLMFTIIEYILFIIVLLSEYAHATLYQVECGLIRLLLATLVTFAYDDTMPCMHDVTMSCLHDVTA